METVGFDDDSRREERVTNSFEKRRNLDARDYQHRKKAIAVGILFDDATVEIENTNRNIAMKKPIVRAILDGASQIATPTLISSLSICIVFVPVLLLQGAAKYLFTPLGMAVVFAMLTSYMLTRTLVPTMMHYLMRPELPLIQRPETDPARPDDPWIWRTHKWFDQRFEKGR